MLKRIKYITYEKLLRKDIALHTAMEKALTHISENHFGIEIDCDAIENIPSSAKTPSGFSIKEVRQFIHFFGKNINASYLHICEAAPNEATEKQVGKLITYLITDFIYAHNNAH